MKTAHAWPRREAKINKSTPPFCGIFFKGKYSLPIKADEQIKMSTDLKFVELTADVLENWI